MSGQSGQLKHLKILGIYSTVILKNFYSQILYLHEHIFLVL